MTETDLHQQLIDKIKTLNERVWEGRAARPILNEWLDNFANDRSDQPSEKLHALFLLSNFMYFGDIELRVLLKALFRDLFRYPIIEKLRKSAGNTLEAAVLQVQFLNELARSRFMGIGNPAESGTHLLYYFRQENSLAKDLFVHTHQIFDGRLDANARLANSSVKRYVIIDDFCGSGDQAMEYSGKVIAAMRQAAERSSTTIEVCYYVLFATTDGLARIRDESEFDRIAAVYELDSSYQTFAEDSRYFRTHPPSIDRDFAYDMCRTHGEQLWPPFPLGYQDGQLMIGFHHNTPDNTLPVLWFDSATPPWTPLFRRYHKM